MIIFGTFDYCEFVLDNIRPRQRCSMKKIKANDGLSQNGLTNGLFIANNKLIRESLFEKTHRDSVFETQYLN